MSGHGILKLLNELPEAIPNEAETNFLMFHTTTLIISNCDGQEMLDSIINHTTSKATCFSEINRFCV